MKRLVLILALSLPALSQTAQKPPAPATPAPQLTELQKTKLENLQLKFTLLQQQQTGLQNDYQSLVQSITAEHPGYRWDAQTSTLVPTPAAPAKK